MDYDKMRDLLWASTTQTCAPVRAALVHVVAEQQEQDDDAILALLHAKQQSEGGISDSR